MLLRDHLIFIFVSKSGRRIDILMNSECFDFLDWLVWIRIQAYLFIAISRYVTIVKALTAVSGSIAS